METATASRSKNTWDEAAVVDVQDRLAVVCGYRNSFDARLVGLAAEALEGGWWQQAGIVSPSHWLSWQAGLSPGHARRVVGVAARRGELPVTFAAFEAGELSFDQVAPICANAPAWADEQACEFAKVMTVPQLQRVLRGYRFDPDPADGEDHTPDVPDPKRERLSLTNDDDGSWRLHGRLDADHGAIVDAALREAFDALLRRGCGVAPSMVDALVELAHRSLDTITDSSRRDRYRVHFHVRGDDGDACDRVGHPIPDWLRDLVCCDTLFGTVIEHDGIPVSLGRSQYTIPEPTRRLVLLRDRGCRVPGCAQDRFVHIHHVAHWPDGGTDTWNLMALCPAHHRMHHRGELGISGNADDPDGLMFTDAHGRVLKPHPLARPPTRPAPPPTRRYVHPLGERLNTWWVTFNPPHQPRNA